MKLEQWAKAHRTNTFLREFIETWRGEAYLSASSDIRQIGVIDNSTRVFDVDGEYYILLPRRDYPQMVELGENDKVDALAAKADGTTLEEVLGC